MLFFCVVLFCVVFCWFGLNRCLRVCLLCLGVACLCCFVLFCLMCVALFCLVVCFGVCCYVVSLLVS